MAGRWLSRGGQGRVARVRSGGEGSGHRRVAPVRSGRRRKGAPLAGRRPGSRRTLDQRLQALLPPPPTAPQLPVPWRPAAASASSHATPTSTSASWPALPATANAESARLVRPLLAAVLVAAVVTTMLALFDLRTRTAESARRSAAAAARVAARDLFSYDHRRLEQDFARARAHLTDELAKEYAATTVSRLGRATGDTQAVVTATVPAAGVVAADRRGVVTLLLVEQQTRMAGAAQPTQHQSLVRLTLREVAGRWKVSQIATF